ncbi:MOSC domain-containing protein [Tabrizicola sp.]|uniref:MOSC domain-containing protein n=1 Tax=Tabrizicola sp. TaxID=2005166 RepID=UPI003F36D754
MSAHPTAESLAAALPQVLQAPKTGSAVELLCFRPGYGQRDFVKELTVTRDRGIPGERWENAPWLKLPDGKGHPGIQVSILPRRVLDLFWRDGDGVPHPGDTFVCDLDTSEANLPEGQLLGVGTAILKVSEVWNDGCAKWKVRYGEPAYDWIRAPQHRHLRLRGVLCSVEQDGVIHLGDPVNVLRRAR